MSELLKAFDSYNEFERTSFFTLSFDTLPSDLILELPLDASKENMDKVLEVLGPAASAYEVVFKHWSTEDTSNADFSQDYVFKWMFKSNKLNSLIWVTLDDDTLTVEFLYDCKDKVLEQWVVEKNHALRKQFGLSRTPTFKVLTKTNSRFHTEEVRTEIVSLDIVGNYNDNFLPAHDCINKAIKSKESGLILLYGVPGTGKTTYIKSLISSHHKHNFIFVQNEFVNSLLDPDFISFLLKQRNSILVIEDAEKVIMSRDHQRENSVVSTILQLTDGLFSDYLNIKFICTFNTNLSKVDTALMRKGRMIAMHEFKALSIEKTNQLLIDQGVQPAGIEMTLANIYNYEQEVYNNLEKKTLGFK